ncbi:MAG TPA: amidohydrolase family protein [Thermoanaerobaculia bacterium]|jgi:imidazolonepropionase-like amidohydrolase|nr:amidohydrolase family protein [Thermoanaerobaculia bacterium]
MRAILLSFLIAVPTFAETIVIRNVNVVSMTSPKVAEKQNVIVRDGVIESVSTRLAKMPAGTKVVDGTGKFLMPGLAEMHGHVPPLNAPNGATDDTLFLYVASGITTVRGMLGHPGQLELREKSKRGEIVAPNLYLAGPSFNGQSVNSPQEAIDKVRAQKKEGWDLLKVHPGLTRDEYDAMAKTAREEGIRFGGHVPAEVGLEHAIEMGQETFDHIDGYAELLEADKGPVDEKKLSMIVKKSKDAGVWIVPTSALWEVLFDTIPLETLKGYAELKYVSQASVDQWSNAYNQRLAQTPREAAKNVIAARTRILRALHEGGVKILMGTDAPQQFNVPGFSLHRELLRMREAGMSNYEILKSGTLNVGQYFAKQDSFGTIEPGRRADLVLVDASPLADITNVAKISGVMVRGRWFSREDLDAGLAKIEAKHKR